MKAVLDLQHPDFRRLMSTERSAEDLGSGSVSSIPVVFLLPSMIPVPGALVPSSNLWGHQAHRHANQKQNSRYIQINK